MISSGTIGIPNHVESLKLYLGNFTCDNLNGQLAHFVAPNSQGDIFCNFAQNSIPGVPHGVRGLIRLYDGNGAVIFEIADAEMQFELGPKDGAWTVIASFAAKGIDSVSGLPVLFRSRGVDPGDDRSLVVDFAVSSEKNFLKAFVELADWLKN